MPPAATSTRSPASHPATLVAWAFAGAFALAAGLAYLPNPLLGPNALFVTNGAHNAVHLLTAAGFAAVATAGPGASVSFMKAFGTVYFLVGVLGWITLGGAPEGHLLGLVHINAMDNVLHMGLAAGILVAGFSVPRVRAD